MLYPLSYGRVPFQAWHRLPHTSNLRQTAFDC